MRRAGLNASTSSRLEERVPWNSRPLYKGRIVRLTHVNGTKKEGGKEREREREREERTNERKEEEWKDKKDELISE